MTQISHLIFMSYIIVALTIVPAGADEADSNAIVVKEKALMSAIARRDHNAVRALLQPVDKERKPAPLPSSKTPLSAAIGQGDRDIVILLLAHGANMEVPTLTGDTALCLAAYSGKTEIVDVLIAAGADVNPATDYSPLMRAAAQGHVQVCRRLVKAGAKLDLQRDEGRGRSALMLAAMLGHSKVAKFLLESGADPNLIEKGPRGHTALMLAAIYDHAEVVRVLIRGRVDVNLRNEMGQSALDVALEYDAQHAAKALEKAGATKDTTKPPPAKKPKPKGQEKTPTPKTTPQPPDNIEEKKQEEGFEPNPPDRKITRHRSRRLRQAIVIRAQ